MNSGTTRSKLQTEDGLVVWNRVDRQGTVMQSHNLTGLNEAGTTIVMVTHGPNQAGYAHRVINLFDGRVVTENIQR